MKEANKEQKPKSHNSPLLDDQLEKLQLKIESIQIPKFLNPFCRNVQQLF